MDPLKRYVSKQRNVQHVNIFHRLNFLRFVVLLGSLLILLMLTAFVYYCARFTPSDNPILHQETTANQYYKPFHRKKRPAQGYSTVGTGVSGMGGMAATSMM